MFSRIRYLVPGVLIALAMAASGKAAAGPIVFSVGGNANPASIQATVDAFRLALGNPDNLNAPGPLDFGRREINWDGGGAIVAAPVGTPFAGFQNIRGALFTTPGTGFLQTPLNAPELAAINPTYATTFGTFSPLRIFTPVGSNVTDATFTVPGNPSQQAVVTGFGAVFTDVDLANSSSLQFFDPNGASLGTFFVPPGTVANGSLSFLGVLFDAGELIGSVRITSGNTALGPNDNPLGGVDIVGLDDFLFSEPRAIPEPSSFVLAGLSVLGLLGYGWRRRRQA